MSAAITTSKEMVWINWETTSSCFVSLIISALALATWIMYVSAGVYVLVVTAKTKLVCSCMDTPGDIWNNKRYTVEVSELPGYRGRWHPQRSHYVTCVISICILKGEKSGPFPNRRAARLPGQATCAARVVCLWVEKNPVPPPNRQALDWSVVLTVGQLCPIVPQDNIVVSNKHNWPEFYPGNPRACPGLEPPMKILKKWAEST